MCWKTVDCCKLTEVDQSEPRVREGGWALIGDNGADSMSSDMDPIWVEDSTGTLPDGGVELNKLPSRALTSLPPHLDCF